ncbi:hypothetical protein B0H14DRAFT_2652867 [Mycena olivaceomarginata]|nr:hypothetical protein B0H14DRAFT_2652867 [Mycena olivaceomarginata]
MAEHQKAEGWEPARDSWPEWIFATLTPERRDATNLGVFRKGKKTSVKWPYVPWIVRQVIKGSQNVTRTEIRCLPKRDLQQILQSLNEPFVGNVRTLHEQIFKILGISPSQARSTLDAALHADELLAAQHELQAARDELEAVRQELYRARDELEAVRQKLYGPREELRREDLNKVADGRSTKVCGRPEKLENSYRRRGIICKAEVRCGGRGSAPEKALGKVLLGAGLSGLPCQPDENAEVWRASTLQRMDTSAVLE